MQMMLLSKVVVGGASAKQASFAAIGLYCFCTYSLTSRSMASACLRSCPDPDKG